jgi:hypothetical protein
MPEVVEMRLTISAELGPEVALLAELRDRVSTGARGREARVSRDRGLQAWLAFLSSVSRGTGCRRPAGRSARRRRASLIDDDDFSEPILTLRNGDRVAGADACGEVLRVHVGGAAQFCW